MMVALASSKVCSNTQLKNGILQQYKMCVKTQLTRD